MRYIKLDVPFLDPWVFHQTLRFTAKLKKPFSLRCIMKNEHKKWFINFFGLSHCNARYVLNAMHWENNVRFLGHMHILLHLNLPYPAIIWWESFLSPIKIHNNILMNWIIIELKVTIIFADVWYFDMLKMIFNLLKITISN